MSGGSNHLAVLHAHAAALAANAADKDAVIAACRAIFAALADPDALASWGAPERDDMLQTLLLQTDCPARPLILAHEAASHMTSGDVDATKKLLVLVTPVLARLLRETPQSDPEYKNLVVFLLTTRALVGDMFSQADITRLHLDWFERFDASDLTLSYSVMFNDRLFGVNRDEILARYWTKDRVIAGLRAHHLVLLEWLAADDWFVASDNTDLADFVKGQQNPGPDDTAATRMLLMRHWQPAGALAADDLAKLGYREDLPLLTDLAASRRARPRQGPTRMGARMLQQPLYQALQAARHVAEARAPFLRPRRKPRVALCLSGQLRGYVQALESWKRSFLHQIDATIFVHSWTGIGRSDAQPFRYTLPFAGTHFAEAYRTIAVADGYEAMCKRYPTLIAALSAGSVTDATHLQQVYDTPHVVLEDDKGAAFAGFSNQDKMHYKIAAADGLAREAGDFDLHMRLRPDLPVRMTGCDWRDVAEACRTRPVLFAEKPYGRHYGSLMIGDQCAIAHPDTMQRYAETYATFPRLAALAPLGCPTKLTGHSSLALSCWTSGVGVEKTPIRFGALCEAAPLESASIRDALHKDGRDDPRDRQLLAAVAQDLA